MGGGFAVVDLKLKGGQSGLSCVQMLHEFDEDMLEELGKLVPGDTEQRLADVLDNIGFAIQANLPYKHLVNLQGELEGLKMRISLVPGNHDPLLPESVWAAGHPFRARLPRWVHVVDRDDFEHALTPEAVLYARPCRSKAGQNDLAMALPARQPGDSRLRIGCVHGCTFDIDGYQTNFPIRHDAAVQRGLDYLAIGDTHSFRDVTPNLPAPTVYPGTPEPTSFDEAGAVRVGRAIELDVAAVHRVDCTRERLDDGRVLERNAVGNLVHARGRRQLGGAGL